MTIKWTAVVPIKSHEVAKSRLQISDSDRRTLSRAFAMDVVQACVEVDSICEVLVITQDPGVWGSRDARGQNEMVRVLRDPEVGLNRALDYAAAQANPETGVLALVADLPCVRPVDIAEFLSLANPDGRSFSPDSAGVGSTALAAGPGNPLQPNFGPKSRALHNNSGALEIGDERLFRMRRDVDTVVDLADALRIGVGSHTMQVAQRTT